MAEVSVGVSEMTLIMVHAVEAGNRDNEIVVFLDPASLKTERSSPEILDDHWVQQAVGTTERGECLLKRRWPAEASTPEMGEGWEILPSDNVK